MATSDETNVTIDSIIVVSPSTRNSMGTSRSLIDSQPSPTTVVASGPAENEQPERDQKRQRDARDDRDVGARPQPPGTERGDERPQERQERDQPGISARRNPDTCARSSSRRLSRSALSSRAARSRAGPDARLDAGGSQVRIRLGPGHRPRSARPRLGLVDRRASPARRLPGCLARA